MKRKTSNPDKTKALAAEILKKYPGNKIYLLYGDLGTGKTTFVKGFAEALGISGNAIKSPTFTFLSKHENLYHYDLYRLDKPDDSIFEYMAENIDENAYVIIEWPEHVENYLIHRDDDFIKINFRHIAQDLREIEIMV